MQVDFQSMYEFEVLYLITSIWLEITNLIYTNIEIGKHKHLYNNVAFDFMKIVARMEMIVHNPKPVMVMIISKLDL